jgi:uncharacterized protein (TIGR02270 family)
MLPVLQPEPLWDILEEHLNEAEFLWELWEHALVSPKYTLAEVEAGPKARLDAHIDALIAEGQEVAEVLLLPVLASETAEPTRVSAAAAALLLTAGDAGIKAVLDALQTNISRRPAIARALEVCDCPDLTTHIRPFLHAPDLDLRDAAARIIVFKRGPLGEVLMALLTSDRATAQTTGLQALLYEPATAQHRRAVLQALRAQETAVRDAAWTAAAVLRMTQIWPELRARSLEPGCGHALLLLALRGAPEDHALLIGALDRPELRTEALWALGFLGTPAAVEASLRFLDDPVLGRLAGEVFSSVTGIDLESEGMTIVLHDDDSVFMPSEGDLLIPHPESMLRWWISRAQTFRAPNERLLHGEEMTIATYRKLALTCNCRRIAAFNLASQLSQGQT